MHAHVLIIGSGPAGLTAALYAARANLHPVVIRGLEPGGLIATTDAVENYPGFPDAINGFELADKMEQQAARFGTRFVDGLVERVHFSDEPLPGEARLPHRITMDSGEIITADAIIVATGASPRKLNVPGEVRLANRGVSYCAVCDGFFFRNKRIVVVGGGNSAVEEAVFLTRFASEVIIVHRRDTLRADPIIEERARQNPKITFRWNTTVMEIMGEAAVEAVRLHHLDSGTEEVVPTDAVFPYIGHVPNTALFREHLALDQDGYLITDGRTRTSIPGVFATGDAVDRIYRQAITSAASGAQAAMEASWYLDSLHTSSHEEADAETSHVLASW